MEKIQHVLRYKHHTLYDEVVGHKHRAFNNFVQRQEAFELMTAGEGKWRMRLRNHANYQIGDEMERQMHLARDAHMATALKGYLNALDPPCCKVLAPGTALPSLCSSCRAIPFANLCDAVAGGVLLLRFAFLRETCESGKQVRFAVGFPLNAFGCWEDEGHA